MEECSSAFAEDRDVTPYAVIDTSTSAFTSNSEPTPTTSSHGSVTKSKLTPYQEQLLELKRKEYSSRQRHRERVIELLQQIADK
jgi:hypothetical protein